MKEKILNGIGIIAVCSLLIGFYYILWKDNANKPDYEDLDFVCEEYYSELKQENKELKEKLDNINQMASDRDYNYNELLDDIEAESIY